VVAATGMEADDLVRIWAEEARTGAQDFVVAHIDKDLDMIDGLHFNYRHNVTYTIEPARALRVFYQQLLMGDSSDSVPGCKGIGKVKATRILEGAADESEMQSRVVHTYMAAHERDWFEQLQLNGRLLYLLKTREDFFDCRQWDVVRALT